MKNTEILQIDFSSLKELHDGYSYTSLDEDGNPIVEFDEDEEKSRIYE